MNGEMQLTNRNIRRTGVRATINGKPNPNYQKHMPKDRQDLTTVMTWDESSLLQRVAISKQPEAKPPAEYQPSDGPTNQRLGMAESHYVVGDDKRGNRVYHFHDCPLDRLYSRLTRQANPLSAENGLRREYTALVKYRHHWFSAGLQDAIGSADLDRIFASDPGSMSGMAKTERQAHHRQQYRQARDSENGIGHKAGIVVDNVVCAEMSLEAAGYSIGFVSRTQARDKAEEMLRESGRKLAKMWGIS